MIESVSHSVSHSVNKPIINHQFAFVRFPVGPNDNRSFKKLSSHLNSTSLKRPWLCHQQIYSHIHLHLFCILLNMICDLISKDLFSIFLETPPEFSGLFPHYYSISSRVIQDLIHSQMSFFKLFLAATSTVCINQRPDYLSFVKSRVNFFKRVEFATLEGDKSKYHCK